MKCDSQPDLRFDELFIPVCVLHSSTCQSCMFVICLNCECFEDVYLISLFVIVLTVEFYCFMCVLTKICLLNRHKSKTLTLKHKEKQ